MFSLMYVICNICIIESGLTLKQYCEGRDSGIQVTLYEAEICLVLLTLFMKLIIN